MKIYTDGAKHLQSQLSRIEEGFIFEGHEITQNINEADLIYSNNSSHTRKEIHQYHVNGKLKDNVKIIFNVLDIPEWCFPNFNLASLREELSWAHSVTSISYYVESQLMRYFGLKSHVIYNPTKEINNNDRKNRIKKFPQFKAMMVGRLRDPSKRVELAVNSLLYAGFNESEVAIVGSENIGWGNYLGIVSDETLNNLYNSVDFVVMTSLGEGLGLPALEGCLGGAIPVVCHDLTTFNEFYPKELGNYPNIYSIANFLRNPPNKINETVDELRLDILDVCDKKIVAKAILKAYYELCN